MNGIIVINKQKNYTSRDIVNLTCKYLKTKKIGHTGTLDPLATGVLVLCVGKATKLVEILTAYEKEYIAEITLGTLTDTLDITGNVLKEEKVNISENDIKKVLQKYIGSYNQEVPIYSAIKVNGQKLYQYARKNEKISLPKRQVEIKKLELIDKIKYQDNKVIFKIKCLVSKGTYIRSLVRDIAISLNTIGTMSMLERTKQGNFEITKANTLEDIKNNDFKFYKIEEVLDNFYQIEIDDKLYFKIKNGALIKNNYNHDIVVFKKNNRIVAIYKKYEKNNTLLKPFKMFLD